jgi:type II secretory pathway pseudopilin PulG
MIIRPFHSRARTNAAKRSRSREFGFAYMMALVMVAVVIITSTVVLERLRILGQRQREEEMIWRGQQYTRAIRLYFRKTGKYPQSLEDLQKAVPDNHFIRQLYKDPMNTNDGSWRLIYVNAAGQIIGSVRYASLQQMALLELPQTGTAVPGLTPQLPGQPGVPVSGFSNSGGNGQVGGQAGGQAGQGGALPPSQPYNPDENPDSSQNSGTSPYAQSGSGSGQGSTSGQPASNGQQNPLLAANAGILQQKPTGPVDGPVLGAFITGVGSKVDQRSVKFRHGGKKYKDWEFIWNPLIDQANGAQQGVGGIGGSGAGTLPGIGGLPIANPNPGGAPPQNGPEGGANPGGQPTPPPQQQPQAPPPNSPTPP